jgi:hypothetical protein
MNKNVVLLSLVLILISCKKQYSGYCISEQNSNYTVIKFQEEAVSQKAAERQVERVMDDKFSESGPWSCEVYD